jgi:DNA-binding Lrp family transcriptional regulator
VSGVIDCVEVSTIRGVFVRYMIAPVQEADNHLDTIDERLLRELAEDARMSAVELGQKVGLSDSAVRRRLKRLQQDHILKYTIVRNRKRTFAEAYVELIFEAKTDVLAFVTRVVGLPEVREAAQIAGRPDALLRVRAESNDRIGVLVNEIRDFPEVSNTKTLAVLHRERHIWGARSAI